MRSSAPTVLRLLLGGALLLAAERGLSARPAATGEQAQTIRITTSTVERLRRSFRADAGLDPDATELEGLVQTEVDDEILYREALARGLDRSDPVVQQRLASNLAFVAEEGAGVGQSNSYDAGVALGMDRGDVVVRRRLIARMRAEIEQEAARVEPTDAELQAALERHPERFARPPRIRLAYTLVGPDGQPQRTELALQSERDLARLLGTGFAREAFALPIGRWAGPIAANLGWLPVWVYETEAAQMPGLDPVRNQVRELVIRERARNAVRQTLVELRRHYGFSVEYPM